MGLFNRKKTEEKDEKAIKQSVPVKTESKKKTSMKDLYEGKSNDVASKKPAKEEKTEKRHGNAYRVLVKPLITEKAANLGVDNKYVFAVDVQANKIEIAKAINEVYGIKPTSVNVVNTTGKKIRQGRSTGKRKDWKKAIITLPKGKTINIYEGV